MRVARAFGVMEGLRMRVARAFGVALLFGAQVAASAEGPSPTASQPAPAPACGQATELLQAKRALAEGDREGALRHLRRAREIVAACARDASEPARTPEMSATAFAQAPPPGCGPA